jgi:tetratricopeptide (TPR) repeat protein
MSLGDAERQLELADSAIEELNVNAAVAHLSAAIRGFTASGDRRQAAVASARLGELYANALGNLPTARAWFARAAALVEDEPPCVEQGWVAVAAMGCDVDDPDVLLSRAELALDRARRFGDINLETKALADAGLAHVQAGRLSEGMALLDEAMALACGPADDLAVAGKSACSFFTACYFAADFHRATSWAVPLRQRGVIGLAPGPPVFVSNHCESIQATLLCELGQWREAEAILIRAVVDFEARMPTSSWHPAIALADLRIRQGRLADAERLLLGKDAHLQALLPAARLHLARGDHDLARATAIRGLRAIGADRLRAAELLSVLVEAELAVGNLDAARRACAELEARTSGLPLSTLQAKAAATRATVLLATGDREAAISAIEAGLAQLSSTQAPWLRVGLLLELARLHDEAGDRASAIIEAKQAAAILAELDVVLAAAQRNLLDRLGIAVPPGAGGTDQPTETAILAREGPHWVVTYSGTTIRLADTKGLRYLAELVANPGVERHALDLVDRVEGVAASDVSLRHRIGDAGELLDAQARVCYRHRIEALRAEIDGMLEVNDLDGAEALQAELDLLVGQLAGAFGLGGRSRRAASAAERARLNVTRALRAATARLTEALPQAGAALDRSVRTGLYCRYDPGEATVIRWIVQSPLNKSRPN